ncbi:unnamed protein product [Pleuronectes platessa]|uniref:Uncharacterized protein n=1 Tax=Pleuronectes platessa TaxID=8262 RepID=A0A9N7VV84_PLEPL|nr:unnamed protein product [Pleuronectes platessa]
MPREGEERWRKLPLEGETLPTLTGPAPGPNMQYRQIAVVPYGLDNFLAVFCAFHTYCFTQLLHFLMFHSMSFVIAVFSFAISLLPLIHSLSSPSPQVSSCCEV